MPSYSVDGPRELPRQRESHFSVESDGIETGWCTVNDTTTGVPFGYSYTVKFTSEYQVWEKILSSSIETSSHGLNLCGNGPLPPDIYEFHSLSLFCSATPKLAAHIRVQLGGGR